ncbi:MAG TPA: hypothetical protein VFE50_06365 [Cyclobacteriaceae bacterium]|nr:hypothetical protein [Cyclobacteriaceae bacterium]
MPNEMAISGGDVYTAAQYVCGYNKNNTPVEVKPFEAGKRFWSPSVAVFGEDVILVTTVHATDNSLLGSYVLVNGIPQGSIPGRR